MTYPHEPVVPEVLVGDLSKPLCCETCGHELELRCANGHRHRNNAGHRHVRAAGTRECCVCKNMFEPRPLQRRCDDCLAAARANLTQRNYKPRVCACGTTFTPTGPRDVRCSTCKEPR